MGEKVYGFHAIEEALKKAAAGSTLYIVRSAGARAAQLEQQARFTGKVAVRKVSRQELERMLPGSDVRDAILDMGGPRREGEHPDLPKFLSEISVRRLKKTGIILFLCLTA